MKKNREEPPIDELFARKLGNMSLPPRPDGFARLQARMGQKEENQRVVIWRNPVVIRYMAAAACLLLVGIFGWLIWPVNELVDSSKVATSTNPAQGQRRADAPSPKGGITVSPTEAQATRASMPEVDPVRLNQLPDEKSRIAQRLKPVNVGKSNSDLLIGDSKPDREAITRSAPEPAIALVKPDKDQTDPKPAADLVVPPTAPSTPDQLAAQAPKSAQKDQRILTVTIPEPDALVDARQAAQDTEEKVVVMQAKETKQTGMRRLFTQLQRVRGNETVVARDDDERGLLERAYKGIKRTLEKDKSRKQ